MNIIIAGDGKVGSMLTRQLSTEGHNITVIDSTETALPWMYCCRPVSRMQIC